MKKYSTKDFSAYCRNAFTIVKCLHLNLQEAYRRIGDPFSRSDFSITEQDYSILLLLIFLFGLYRLKSYCVWFEQEKISYCYLIDADMLLNTGNTPNRMAYQVPGTVTATHQQTSPFPLYPADRTTLINITWK